MTNNNQDLQQQLANAIRAAQAQANASMANAMAQPLASASNASSAAKKPAAKKVAKKPAAKKATAKKPAAKKVATKKAVASTKAAATKKVVAKKAATKKVVAKKATTKKVASKANYNLKQINFLKQADFNKFGDIANECTKLLERNSQILLQNQQHMSHEYWRHVQNLAPKYINSCKNMKDWQSFQKQYYQGFANISQKNLGQVSKQLQNSFDQYLKCCGWK